MAAHKGWRHIREAKDKDEGRDKSEGSGVAGSCLSCTLTEAEMQERRLDVLQHIKQLVRGYQPLEDGYVFRFDAEDDGLSALLRLIQLERKCCAFLRLRLTVEPNGGPVSLEMTGPAGTREFIEAEMELMPRPIQPAQQLCDT